MVSYYFSLHYFISALIFFFFFKILFIIHERHTERGRDRGRGRSRLHAGTLMWDSIPGPQGQSLS